MKITRLSKKLATLILATISMMLAGSALGQFGTYNGFEWEVVGNGVGIYGYTGAGGAVAIPSTISNRSVTTISFEAFDNCASLTSIAIPNSVTSIGASAFFFCNNLTNITIGNGITSIGIGTFYECGGLTSITIPNSVTNIGESAFEACSSLTSVTVPNSVTSIGDSAFDDCISLTSVTIPNSVTSIGDGAFEDCLSLTSITIPNSVASIGADAFVDCPLAYVCFEGDAPLDGGGIFLEDKYLYFVFYVNGTKGWGATFSGVPTLACAECSGAVTTSAQPYKDVGCLPCQDSRADPSVGNPIRLGNGNKFEEVADYTTAGANALSFMRYYNSLGNPATDAVMLGVNWRSTYDRYLRVSGSVIAEREDGQELIFTLNGPNWTSDNDVDLKLVQLNSVWMLTNSDDSVETYNSGGFLTSVQGRDGYRQTLQYNGGNQLESVSDSYGRTLQFAYQGNLLQTVTTPDGLVLTYGYNSSGVQPDVPDRLASVTYSTTPETSQSYLYENTTLPFALTGIIDENGSRFATWTYDSSGRATSSQHAGGNDLTTVFYNDTDGSRIVTNALGAATVYKFTTLQGVPKVTEIDRLATDTVPAAVMTQTYDGNGYLANSTDWNTNLTTAGNDYRGLLVTSKEAVGTSQARTTTNTYLANFHLPVRSAAPRDTSTFIYDTNGNRLTLTETDTTTGTVPYSTKGQTRVWTNTFDSLGHVLTVTGPRTDVLATTTFTYDKSNNVSSITDPLGHLTRLTNYNSSGLPLTMIDPNGVTNKYVYDIRDRLLSSTVMGPSGNATNSYVYDAVGQLILATYPNGMQLRYQYDPSRCLLSVSNNIGESTSYTLDAARNITKQIIKTSSATVSKTQTRVFDALSRLIQDIGASGQTNSYAYDNLGNRFEMSDGLNNLTLQYFDPLNRLIDVLDPLYYPTSFGYDGQDNQTNITDPRSLVTSYVYDGFGRVIQESSPDSGTTVYTLDKSGNPISEVDARGVVTSRTFDKLDRVLTEKYPASINENITYTYDATSGGNYGVGHLTGYSDETGSTSLKYNERGDMLSTTRKISGTAYTTAYNYDIADNITNIIYPSGHVISYGRDALGRVSSVVYRTSVGGTATKLATDITYEPFGPLTGLLYGNGLTLSNSYDLDYRLTNITTSGTSKHIQNLRYSYDAADNITNITDNLVSGNNQAFIYDGDHQITNATGNYGTDGYTYDLDGNRLSSVFAGISENYFYLTNFNRLQSAVKLGVTRNFSYNLNGTLASDNRGSATNILFGYGNRNRYKTLTVGSSRLASYEYNALGERLVKIVGTTTTIYHYDEDAHLIAESVNGSLVREYVWLDDVPLAQIESSGTIYYIHPDDLNRPQKMTDVNQNIVWDNEPGPFGEVEQPFAVTSVGIITNKHVQIVIGGQMTYNCVLQASTNQNLNNWVTLAINVGPFTFTDTNTLNYKSRFYRVLYTPTSSAVGTITQNLRFPGQYYDSESGLNYNAMRDYDATLGRYIESDPSGLNGGVNLYGYVANNPITSTDMEGLYIDGGTDLTSAQGQIIVTTAAGWAGTLYAPWYDQHSGENALKKVGADCSGAVHAIYVEAGFNYKYKTAKPDDHQPGSLSAFYDAAAQEGFPFRMLNPSEPEQPGDVVLYEHPGHMSILASGGLKSGQVWSAHQTGVKFKRGSINDFPNILGVYRYQVSPCNK